MIYQNGIVSEIRGNAARVRFRRAGGCGQCAGDQGCGLGPILSMFKLARNHDLDIDIAAAEPEIRVGDAVRIAISGKHLLRFAILAYLVPLSGLFSGAWLATLAIPQAGDVSALFGAVIGALCASQLLARHKISGLTNYLRRARLERVMPGNPDTS